jgi:hypothetical protein
LPVYKQLRQEVVKEIQNSVMQGLIRWALKPFFFFFHWHYSPLWALPCRTISLHFPYLSPTLSIIFKSIQLFPLFDFRNNKFFYCVGLLAPRQTPNLEDQGIPFCLGHHP